MFHESRSNIFQLLSNNFYSCKITSNAKTATAMISLIRTLNKVGQVFLFQVLFKVEQLHDKLGRRNTIKLVGKLFPIPEEALRIV